MENSKNSISKALSYNEITTECPEESGWTMYFDDFFANNNEDNEDNEDSSFSSGFECSSLISDAASSVAKKGADNEHVVGLSLEKSCHRLSSFKKRKTKGVLVDDALEDTASSPVASPKICNMMDQVNKNPKQKDIMGTSQEKGRTSGQIAGRSELGFIGRDGDNTKLKKRGLCLVPLSLVANYLG